MIRWNLSVSEETDRTVRMFLARNGGKKGDLSRFVDEAVRRRAVRGDAPSTVVSSSPPRIRVRTLPRVTVWSAATREALSTPLRDRVDGPGGAVSEYHCGCHRALRRRPGARDRSACGHRLTTPVLVLQGVPHVVIQSGIPHRLRSVRGDPGRAAQPGGTGGRAARPDRRARRAAARLRRGLPGRSARRGRGGAQGHPQATASAPGTGCRSR